MLYLTYKTDANPFHHHGAHETQPNSEEVSHEHGDPHRASRPVAWRLARQARRGRRACRHRRARAQLQRLEREPAANAACGDPPGRCARRRRCDCDLPAGASAVRAAGRIDRAVPRRIARSRLGRDLARAHDRHRGDRSGVNDDDGEIGHAAGDDPEGRRRSRLLLSARSRLARLLRDRRQSLDQCRRQPRDPLRHDARTGARPRGGAARRHHHHQPQQADEEQRGL